MFIVVAIVIFGIFVSLSYTLFGKEGLSNDLKGLFEQSTEQANVDLTNSKTLFNETDFTDKKVDYIRFTPEIGTSILIDDNDLYGKQQTFRWDFKQSNGTKGILVNLTDKEVASLKVGDKITFDYLVKNFYGDGNLNFTLGGDLKGNTQTQYVNYTKGYEPYTTTLEVTDKTLSDIKKGNIKVTMTDVSAVVWFAELNIKIQYK